MWLSGFLSGFGAPGLLLHIGTFLANAPCAPVISAMILSRHLRSDDAVPYCRYGAFETSDVFGAAKVAQL